MKQGLENSWEQFCLKFGFKTLNSLDILYIFREFIPETDSMVAKSGFTLFWSNSWFEQ